MTYLIAFIIALVAIFLLIGILGAIAAILTASDAMEREIEDRDQMEWIRQWRQKKDEKNQ